MNNPFLANWTRQFRKGLLELAILNDINNRGMYAYEIERTLCKSHGLLMGTGVICRRRVQVQATATVPRPFGLLLRQCLFSKSSILRSSLWPCQSSYSTSLRPESRTPNSPRKFQRA